MYSLAIARFDIPGEAGFPLNGVYAKPSTPEQVVFITFVLISWRGLKSFINIRVWIKTFSCKYNGTRAHIHITHMKLVLLLRRASLNR